MDRCPTCQAIYKEGIVCYRCQTDLSRILAVERAAVRCQQQTFAALENGYFDTAHDFAKQACELHRSPDSIKALALAVLALRKFDKAMVLWQEYRMSRPLGDETT